MGRRERGGYIIRVTDSSGRKHTPTTTQLITSSREGRRWTLGVSSKNKNKYYYYCYYYRNTIEKLYGIDWLHLVRRGAHIQSKNQ